MSLYLLEMSVHENYVGVDPEGQQDLPDYPCLRKLTYIVVVMQTLRNFQITSVSNCLTCRRQKLISSLWGREA